MSGIRNRQRLVIAAVTVLSVVGAIFVPLPPTGVAAQVQSVEIHARAFAYDPSIIEVQRGDTVTLRLEAMDSVNGLYIDEYDLNLQAEPGRGEEVTFVTDREGKFRFRCSVSWVRCIPS